MGDNMLNFTIGPVMSPPDVLEIGGRQVPYFRTSEFSEIMLENERLMLELVNAPQDSRCVFLTSSGTGAMEACVMDVLSSDDKVMVINGGTFGQRFVELCSLHGIKHTVVRCEFGNQVTSEQLEKLSDDGYTALLVNMCETSSGVLYDMELLSRFCNENHMLLIVDAISSFLADQLDMTDLGAAVVMTGSQKALAVHPGVSVVVLSPEAIRRVESNPVKCMYLSLKGALKDMERGQTPFTPAVSALLQINKRLRYICENGGATSEIKRVKEYAEYFRKRIKAYPLEFVVRDSENRSNAVTALRLVSHRADDICKILKDEYSIWVCPNGGIYKDDVFRVGHIGSLTEENFNALFRAFDDLTDKGIM